MSRHISKIEADLAKARSAAEAASEIPFFGSWEMRESAWKDLAEAHKRVDALEAELKAAQLRFA
jgi:hypothetical protein